MILFLSGCSHTGKTLLAQRLLEKYHFPYLSIDHLKMGLIRSGVTSLTPSDDDQLTGFLWPIVREIAKTAIENEQNLIIEGCYIPFDWEKDFDREYRKQIQYRCLIMSREYIANHLEEIRSHANAIERRLDDSCLTPELLIRENEKNLELCRRYGCEYLLIQEQYEAEVDLELEKLELVKQGA